MNTLAQKKFRENYRIKNSFEAKNFIQNIFQIFDSVFSMGGSSCIAKGLFAKKISGGCLLWINF
jgi:hypothetical protein